MTRLTLALLTALVLPTQADLPVPQHGLLPSQALFPGHFIAFSSDGSTVCTTDGWWTVDTGEELEGLEPLSQTPSTTDSLASPDGSLVASILNRDGFDPRNPHYYRGRQVNLFPEDRRWTLSLAILPSPEFQSIDFSPEGRHIAVTVDYEFDPVYDERKTPLPPPYTALWDLSLFLSVWTSELLLLDQDDNPLAGQVVYLGHGQDMVDNAIPPVFGFGFYSIRVVTDSNGRALLPVYKTGDYNASTYYVWPGHPRHMGYPVPVWNTIYLEEDNSTLLQLFIGHIGADRIWTTSPLEDPSTSLPRESWGSLKHPTR